MNTPEKPTKISGDAGDTLVAELGVKKLQLHWLLQITKAINYNFSTKQLLDVFEHVLHSQLKVEKLALFIREPSWKCALMYGTDTAFSEIDVDRILSELNKLHNLEVEQELWVGAFDAILPVYHKDQLLAYALVGGLSRSVIPKRNELIPFVQTITNLIVVAIENNHVSGEKIRQAAMRRDLELAAQMQSMLFPDKLPDVPGYRLEAIYLPHQEVGGDYYDYITLNEEEFVFCMADVSGKGIPAALLCSNFQANLHAHVRIIPSLSDLVKLLNKKVFANAKGEKFITFFIGKYNVRTRELIYVNSGHNPPFLIHEKVVFMLDEGSTALGMFEELPFVNVGKTFVPGNAFLHCYTDGVTDVENEAGEEFGTFRLREFFTSRIDNHDLKAVQQQLVDRLASFKQRGMYTDDITLLSCWFKA
ncbi:MAG: PP2C family protein-serine/threonine phosphatase [Bacteroidota bacterium]